MNTGKLAAVKGILFDLDGTLLNVEMNSFVFGYLEGLSHCFTDLANHRVFYQAVLDSAHEMLHADDDSRTNEEFFLARMSHRLDIPPLLFQDRLKDYFRDGLHNLAPLVRPFPLSRRILKHCFAHGLTVVIATNPVFPRPVVDARLQWGRLDDFPFNLITSYENCRFCKPHPRYFLDILDDQGLSAEESLMVGNDADFDLPASRAGLSTFLLDDDSSTGGNRSRQADFHGSHEDLLKLIGEITRNSPNH